MMEETALSGINIADLATPYMVVKNIKLTTDVETSFISLGRNDSKHSAAVDWLGEELTREVEASHGPVPAKPQQLQSNDSSVVRTSSWNDWDVPIGRAHNVHDFIGNTRYRNLVQEHKQAYQNALRRSEKALISAKILNTIESNGGRFLIPRKQTQNTGGLVDWEEISKEKALAKISQAMRMATRRPGPSMSQSSQAKSCASPALLPASLGGFNITVPPRESLISSGPPREIQFSSPLLKNVHISLDSFSGQALHTTTTSRSREEPAQQYFSPPLLDTFFTDHMCHAEDDDAFLVGEFSSQHSFSSHYLDEWLDTEFELNGEDFEPFPFTH